MAARVIGENSELQSAMSHQYFGKCASLGARVAAFSYLAVATPKHTTTNTAVRYRCQEPFLARLEFLSKTGCVPHYFQYKEVTFLFPPKMSLKFLIIRFLTSVAYYCIQGCQPKNESRFFGRFFFRFFATENRLFKVGFSVTPKKRNRKTDSVFFGRFFFK